MSATQMQLSIENDDGMTLIFKNSVNDLASPFRLASAIS